MIRSRHPPYSEDRDAGNAHAVAVHCVRKETPERAVKSLLSGLVLCMNPFHPEHYCLMIVIMATGSSLIATAATLADRNRHGDVDAASM